jgi:hypothetical protein
MLSWDFNGSRDVLNRTLQAFRRFGIGMETDGQRHQKGRLNGSTIAGHCGLRERGGGGKVLG